MKKAIVNALETLLKISFFLIIIFTVISFKAVYGDLGIIFGLLMGLMIAIVVTGTIFILLMINENLEIIKANTAKENKQNFSDLNVRADGTKID